MVSLKKYLALSFIFLVVVFLPRISFAVPLGYDTFLECTKSCSSGICSKVESTGKYLCELSLLDDCTKGDVQYKPEGSCGTTSRTCCGLGSWSEWGGKCCTGTKLLTSQNCTASNGKTGTQTRTVTCNSSTGNWEAGPWGTCVAPDCSSGETKACPSNKNQVIKCLSNGKWSDACSCANPGNGKIYCQGMARPINTPCVHGIWSEESCTGRCCCLGDIPVLMTGVGGLKVPQCNKSTGGMAGACACQYKDTSLSENPL